MRPPFCFIDNSNMNYSAHLDNPQAVKDWKLTLSDEELQAYQQGQLSAIAQVLGQIRESKIKMFNEIHAIDDEGGSKTARFRLRERIRILDAYDRHYSKLFDYYSDRADFPALLTLVEEEYA